MTISKIKGTVNKPLGEVYSWLCNINNLPIWNSEVREIKSTQADAVLPEGATFKTGDGLAEYEFIVTKVQPGSFFEFEQSSKAKVKVTFKFAATAVNETYIEIVESLPSNPIGLINSFFSKLGSKKKSEQTLIRIKENLETDYVN